MWDAGLRGVGVVWWLQGSGGVVWGEELSDTHPSAENCGGVVRGEKAAARMWSWCEVGL